MFIADGVPVLTRGKGTDAGDILMRRASSTSTPSTQSKAGQAQLGNLPATFAGTLPCADCPGIRYELNLSPDQSYTLRNTYLERSVAPLESKGSWATRQNTLVLTPSSGKGQSFAIKSAETLRMLDQSGKENTSKLNYDLKRVAATTGSLKETYWKLTHLGGDPVTVVANQKEPNIILHTADNRITGSGGCNSISGTYDLNGDNLKFGQTISTMMACVNGMATEQSMLKALLQARRYKITGQQLNLLDEAGKTLARFEAVALR
jgi:heat shock protein HslJ